MKVVYVVLPNDIDDPARPSGGNTYDRQVCNGLVRAGWELREQAVAGNWPWPDAVAEAALAHVLAAIPDGAPVLIDGLIASTTPSVLLPHASRLSLVVLVHLPLGAGPPGHQVPDAKAREGAVLGAASAVVTTSPWTRQELLDLYPLREVVVAEPGVGRARLSLGSPSGGELLCVGAVTAHKGHDVLADALAAVTDLPWTCRWVGALDREPEFVLRVRDRLRTNGLGERVSMIGVRTGADLDDLYVTADLVLSASLAETYGMTITEALARGVPVIATAVGGVPSALGRDSDGRRPGSLVPPGDSSALGDAIRTWLSDADLRVSARRAARDRRTSLSSWTETTDRIAAVLSGAVR